jgi:XTP/dITP diphosphohydrolase
MHTLIFATNNAHKVEETKAVLPPGIVVVSLREAGIMVDIPEPHDTLEANASEKSEVIFRLTGMDCFSEDTGLEVEALNGAPGVLSARYAGENASFEDNVRKLLLAMEGQTNRQARFRTVISLRWKGEALLFEGICEGTITEKEIGNKGFGYDPVFVPAGSTKTFGTMSLEEKGQFSHRARAVSKLVDFLKKEIPEKGSPLPLNRV